jgi:hypothetical protein
MADYTDADLDAALARARRPIDVDAIRKDPLGAARDIDTLASAVRDLRERLARWEQQDDHEAMVCWHNEERANKAEAACAALRQLHVADVEAAEQNILDWMGRAESWRSDANRLAERCAKDEIELDALCAEIASHGPEGRNFTNAQHHALVAQREEAAFRAGWTEAFRSQVGDPIQFCDEAVARYRAAQEHPTV